MLVKVTQKHIDAGEVDDCMLCPIALALSEAGLQGVDVGTFTASWRGSHGPVILPCSAQHFIIRFDAGCPVEPFEFELEDA